MSIRLLIIAGLLLSLGWTEVRAQESEEDTSASFEKLVEDATLHEGFINSYQKDGKLYLAVPKDMLNMNFLMKYEIAQGIGSSGLYGGTMLNIFEGLLVSLEEHEGKIFLVQKPHRYVADPNTAESKAVDLTFGSSVLETAEIEATNEDSVMLIDAYSWFVSDLSGISDRVKYAVSSNQGNPGRASLDKDRSYLESVNSFPQNTNVTAMLTFKNDEESAPRSVPDDRYIPVGIHYTLAALPEEPMETRMADDRVGFFMTVHKDFTSDDKSDFFRRYVNKWRLECSEAVPEGDLCEPENPVVYYIDHTVPKRYRRALKAGVDAWAEAFEAAGFKNAIHAEMLPEGAVPEDIRYPTLRWNTSDEPGYGAIGPSIVDPRTGEILDADILFEASMVQGFKDSWRNMIDPATAMQTVLGFANEEVKRLKKGMEFSNMAAEFSDQGMFLRSALMARGEIAPDQPVPEEFVNEALKWVTMHEVGHTLGLRHNFRSSVDTPMDKLYDRRWAEKNGVFSSVMEYPSPNVAPEGVKPGYYYNPGVGSYDRWAVSYGYTPDDATAKKLARLGAKEGHAYGTDEDTRGSGALDPTINVYDLGADPLAWGKQRADIVRNMIPRVPEIAKADNVPYYRVTNLYQNLLGQYARAVAVGVKYIGGQYQYRDHVGDPEGRPPFVAVEREKQLEALDLLVDYVFREEAITLPADVYRQMGADRWSHWGNSNTFDGRIDYPLHKTVLEIQSGLLNALTSPARLSRIRDAEAKFGKGNVLTIPELMGKLQASVWAEILRAPGKNISSNRRDLQRAHLDRMTSLLTDAPESLPADARSVIRMQLRDLKRQIARRLTPPGFNFDDYTKAHLLEAQARIDRALDAGLELKN